MKLSINIKRLFTASAVFLAAIMALSSCEKSSTNDDTYDYLSVEEVNLYIENTVSKYPSITAVEKIGISVEGKAINALIISSYSGSSTGPADLEMEPRVRISAAIHGNEKVTTHTIIRFADYILSEYSSGNTEIINLVKSRYIVLIPVVNPDGYAIWSRYNSNGIDLNRNFSREWTAAADHGDSAFSEPESSAIRDYSILKRFTTSLTFHGGDVVVNMPFDYTTVRPSEYDLVKYMGLEYTQTGTFLDNPDILDITGVEDGTVNGGDWYVVTGSMQDWSYLDAGCLDYTVEISVDKAPSTYAEAENVYNYNRDSILAFIKESGMGVYGRVTSDGTTGLEGVKITIPGGDIVVYTDSEGYYHRMLSPGTYSLTFELTGYTSQTADATVPDSDPQALQNITLVNE